MQPQADNKPEVVLPDFVTWERTVSLNFGGNGARFSINAGAGNYQAVNSTAPTQGNDALYDVTDSLAPQVVLMDGGGKFTHTGGDRTYVMTGNGTLWSSSAAYEPALSKYTPFANDAAFNLQVLYITPGAFAGAADALVKHRQAQGYSSGYFGIEIIK